MTEMSIVHKIFPLIFRRCFLVVVDVFVLLILIFCSVLIFRIFAEQLFFLTVKIL